jgi:type I restriction enzyme S subunit
MMTKDVLDTTTGSIPRDWEVVELDEICTVDWGNTSLTKKIYVPYGFPAYSASGQDGFLDFYEQEGDAIVLSAIGARCGKCFWASGKWTAIKNTIVIKSRRRSNIDLRYLFYRVNNERFWPRSGTSQPFIAIGRAKKQQISIPPLPEQRAIAHVLSTVREAIEATERVIAAAHELKRSLMKHLFTYGPVPVDKVDNISLIETEIGDLPDGWRVDRFENVCKFTQYGTSQRCDKEPMGFPVLRIPNIIGGKVDISDLKYTKLPESTAEKLKLEEGDVIFVRTNGRREYVGRSAVYKREISNALFASYLIRMRLKENTLLPDFVQGYTETSRGRSFLSGRASGAADGKFNINSQIIKNVQVPVPPIDQQQDVVNIIEICSSKIAAENDHKIALEALFNSLLHYLMTGKLRVPITEVMENTIEL